MAHKDGGPAFPAENTSGMTKLDYFAGQAMHGLIGHPEEWGADTIDELANKAYEIARAMLEVKAKQ